MKPAQPGDRYGDISADLDEAHAAYKRWLESTRPAGVVSPDGTRRPHWLLRPLRPAREAWKLPTTEDHHHEAAE